MASTSQRHRHEACFLQLLHGHQSITQILGYCRVEHFAFPGLKQILGKELKAMLQPGHAIKPGAVPQDGEQLVSHSIDTKISNHQYFQLSVLKHLYAHNIIHCDIKSASILSPNAPSVDCASTFCVRSVNPGVENIRPFQIRTRNHENTRLAQFEHAARSWCVRLQPNTWRK